MIPLKLLLKLQNVELIEVKEYAAMHYKPEGREKKLFGKLHFITTSKKR